MRELIILVYFNKDFTTLFVYVLYETVCIKNKYQ